MLRASSVKQSVIFMIRKFNNVHTCSIDYHRNAHRHATSSVIAEQIMGKLDYTYGSYDPTAIARDMEREFGVKISHHQARESNPGTVTHIEVDSRNRFHYLFLAFGASIRGYLQYMRPVICVDGSHLKGPYKGTLLLATAQDANKQIYPKNSIKNAIAHLFPWAHHGCCVWHMEKNLIQRFSILVTCTICWPTVQHFDEQQRRIFELNVETCPFITDHVLSGTHLAYYAKWFYEHRASATACSTILSPTMENELRTTFEAGTRLRAHGLTNNLTQVGISNDTDIVDFSKKTCTCREFQLNRMPCIHATRAACLRGTSLYDLCSSYYTSEYWKGAYGEAIYPIQREVGWNVLLEITGTPIMPPSVRRPPSRPPTRRKRSRHEYTTRLRKCTRCGGLGHNRTTCSNHTVPCLM
ncbi:uncharacterized protein LOC111378430 [Olea europaea var. sylvestris]|uniref:uncharacterized protein LOC111378430 n=1 Tax=Olea europaea var. sylvestris TaxID=158386 RepID=UPI000C1CF168|nr:uncharacterized protein LOC111378430 [Olea europaea var. sylvestris]